VINDKGLESTPNDEPHLSEELLDKITHGYFVKSDEVYQIKDGAINKCDPSTIRHMFVNDVKNSFDLHPYQEEMIKQLKCVSEPSPNPWEGKTADEILCGLSEIAKDLYIKHSEEPPRVFLNIEPGEHHHYAPLIDVLRRLDIEVVDEACVMLDMNYGMGDTHLIKCIEEMDAREKDYISYLSQGRIDRPHFRTLEKKNKKRFYK